MAILRSADSLPESHLPGPKNLTLSIFLISVLGLFLELMLIRWISTEVRIFAYLQNTVLIVCFLGLGMGCFTCRQPVRVRRALVALLLLTTILAIPATRAAAAGITDLLSVLSDLLIWQSAIAEGPWSTVQRVTVGLTLVLVLMVLLWEIFVPLGQILGRTMDKHPRTIWAYSVNVTGSLVGIWLFVALSALWLPPWVWIAIAVALVTPYVMDRPQRLLNAALLGGILVAGVFASRDPDAIQVAWSPYQKLVLKQSTVPPDTWSGEYLISVNNAGYQGIIDLSDETTAASPYIPDELRGLSQYDIPGMLHGNATRTLLVGSGSGNDVAGALRRGAERVTAVEIDPAIIEMGRRYHPERPYQDSRVTVVNDDARSFFATTDQQFDVVVFGLLDSHTTTAMTNARLDHYVYTEQSLRRVKSLLADGGVVVLSFEAAKPYIADRIGTCLQRVFEQEPMVFRIPSNPSGWGGVMFVCGDLERVHRQLETQPRLAQLIDNWQQTHPVQLSGSTELATDDWPYIYLESRKIPSLYYLLAGLLLVLVGYARYRLKTPVLGERWGREQGHFFFLGAAFLLLEVQNISKASVVLGNTWVVNAVIISGILGMILLANVVAAKLPKLSVSLVAACLIASCLTMYWVDIAEFGFLPYVTKIVFVGAFTTLPLMFAGILFIRSFNVVDRKDQALGANLMGALVGGILQSVSFVTGIKGLLLIVTGLYLAALLFRPREIANDNTCHRDTNDDHEISPQDTQRPLEEPIAV